MRRIHYLAMAILGGWLLISFGCENRTPGGSEHLAVLSVPSVPPQRGVRALREAVAEVRRLNPDRVILLFDSRTYADSAYSAVGDSLLQAPRQFSCPSFFVPNLQKLKDLRKGGGKRLLKRRYFRVVETGALRLFFLDDADSAAVDRISARELRWLQQWADRGKSRKPAVAFIDRPVWDSRLFPGPNNWWSEVHPLLRRIGVRYLIAGYRSGYLREMQRDSVVYIRSAGIADTLEQGFSDLGGFRHFLWIGVRKGKISLAPVKLGAVRAEEVVTGGEVAAARKNAWKLLSQPDFPVPERPRKFMRRIIQVRVKNPFPEALHGTLRWRKLNEDWRIYPPEAGFVLPPASEKTLSFTVWLASLNSLNRNLPRLITALPPLAGVPPRPVYRLLAPVRKYGMPHRNFSVTVDGDLSEWNKETTLLLNQEFMTTGIAGWNADDLSVSLYTAWDTTGIFLGVDVKDNRLSNPFRDGRIRRGDCVEIGVDALGDRHSPGFDDNDHDLGFAFTAHGPIAWRWAGPPQFPRGRVLNIPFAVQRLPAYTIYEIFIPAREIAPAALKPDARWGMTVAVHDDDGGGWKGAMQWTAGLVGEPYPALFARVRLRE